MTHRILRSGARGAARSAAGALALAVSFFWPAGNAWPIQQKNIPRVTKGDFHPVLVLTGSLTALRSEEFKVPITPTWRIQIKWMAKEGDSVKAGDPVVRFDTANLAAELETTQESVRTKREEITQKEADYRHQQFELEVAVKKAENEMRRKEIDASIPEGIESQFEYDKKQLEKKKSDHSLKSTETNKLVKLVETDAQIKTLEIEIEELEAKLLKLRKSLDELTLTAHSAGAVIYAVDDWSGRKVQVGDTVFATRTIAQIPDLSSLRVQAWVSETHVQQIQAGQAVDLYLDAYPENRFKGIIREVSQSAEAIRRWGKSNYFRADIEMDRLDPDIMKPGMSVKCEVLGTPQKDVLLVPLEMTFFDGGSFWVKPEDGEPLSVDHLGFNEFALAASPEKNPGLKAGRALQPIDGLEAKKDTETDDGKAKD
jgi:multidrug efflux pump subunit AcrA (membrane-fusion protein)